jgi:hypothetical protein
MAATTLDQPTHVQPIRIQAHHAVVKKLGAWTTSRAFEVRARRGSAVVDLRSPHIPPGDVEVRVDIDHAMVKLLVPDEAIIDQWDLRIVGRGKVKDAYGQGVEGGRVIRIVGQIDRGEIRVHRGGVAVMSAIFSREFFADMRRARKEGRVPTIADPAHAVEAPVPAVEAPVPAVEAQP